MTSIWQRYQKLSPELRRYLVVGVSIYLFELLIIALALRLGTSDVVAVGISFWSGLLLSFIVQKIVTFGDSRLHYKVLLPQMLAYGLLVLFNFGFTLVLTALLADHITAAVARTLALGITVIWNFYLYKTKIFQRQEVVPDKKTGAQAKSAKTVKQQSFISSLPFAHIYVGLALTILAASTVWWSWLGARLNQMNADQLVNPYLFESAETWHQSMLPGQHSFLLKWPIFFSIKVLHYSDLSFTLATIGCALLTVLALVLFMRSIERRPYVFAGLCLALSSVLLLIPIQPYAGGLLPVNMAMVTTRNIEYIVYILALIALFKARGLKDWRWVLAAAALAILIANDKLFLSMGLGAALLALVAYGATRQWEWVSAAVRWFFVALTATILALVIIAALDAFKIVTIVEQPGAGPYNTVDTAKDLALGIFYGVMGILTNMGANPAFDALTLREVPNRLAHHMATEAGAGYIVNLAIMALASFAALRLLWLSMRGRLPVFAATNKVAIALIWSLLCACALFVASDHYYAVDARYLAITLFALFVALTVWLKTQVNLSSQIVMLAQIPLLVGIVGGLFGALNQYQAQAETLEPIDKRNAQIVKILEGHGTQVLIGDYWRVVPIKHMSAGKQAVLPLETCTEPRTTLTNAAWRPDLRQKGFAYLLTLEGSLTDFPDCDLKTITTHFGLPNSSALVSGTLAKPKELLLFYDHGQRSGNPTRKAAAHTASILPVALDELMKTTCPVPTIMNIVAHQDDDLLFMSPDLLHDVREGHCIRNIYVTAGDAGSGAPYWLSREQGSQAAFDYMLGGKQNWQSRVVKLPHGQYVSIVSPRANPKISLIFLHLPDGNLRGEGFGTRGQSLARLYGGSIKQLGTVDGQSQYSTQELVDGLADLMHTYLPSEVRTQSSRTGGHYPDHSDHGMVGRLAQSALDQYQVEQFGDEFGQIRVPIQYYVGYPIHEMGQNVTGKDLEDKQAAFLAYAQFDPSVCRSRAACHYSPTYGSYLNSQYATDN